MIFLLPWALPKDIDVYRQLNDLDAQYQSVKQRVFEKYAREAKLPDGPQKDNFGGGWKATLISKVTAINQQIRFLETNARNVPPSLYLRYKEEITELRSEFR